MWVIKSIDYTHYDENGNVVADSTTEEPGEIVCMRSKSVYASNSWYMGAVIDYENDEYSEMNYFTDQLRFKLRDYEGKLDLKKNYTLEKNGNLKKELVFLEFFTNSTGANKVKMKQVIILKEKIFL